MDGEETKSHLVIGTAGHIDHGKTSLVKALTGTDTDQLVEEKERGITIDLGFAFYGEKAAFVDVPGHERLVKTMVAGASAMQAAMLVIAADDGIMPQTMEHLAVLEAMGIRQGIAVITKADLVERDWLELVVEEARELMESSSLENVPVLVVDSISGRGLNELKAALDKLVESAEMRDDPGFFRMPVDRSFIIKGYGRVVTGTIWSGKAVSGDRIELLPGRKSYRVRGLQAHGNPVEQVHAGDRAALNLSGDHIPERGHVLTEPGRMVETDFFDARVSLIRKIKDARHRMRVRIHIGTGEVIGRLLIVGGDLIPAGGSGYARLQLESPVSVMSGDRGVIRYYSPVDTLGGFRVLDPQPPDRRRSIKGLVERFESLNGTDIEVVHALIESRGLLEKRFLVKILPWDNDRLDRVLDGLMQKEGLRRIDSKSPWFVNKTTWDGWKRKSAPTLRKFHRDRPEENGMPKLAWGKKVTGHELADEVLDNLIKQLVSEGSVNFDDGLLSLADHKVTLRKADEKPAEMIFGLLEESGINSPLPATIADQLELRIEEVRRLLRSLKQVDRVVLFGEKVAMTKESVNAARDLLGRHFSADDTFTVGEAAEVLRTTRKYAVPLLEYFDGKGFTCREDEKRRIVG